MPSAFSWWLWAAACITRANVSVGAGTHGRGDGGQVRRLEPAEIETKKEEEGCSTEQFLWPLLQTTVTKKHPVTPWMASDELF